MADCNPEIIMCLSNKCMKLNYFPVEMLLITDTLGLHKTCNSRNKTYLKENQFEGSIRMVWQLD